MCLTDPSHGSTTQRGGLLVVQLAVVLAIYPLWLALVIAMLLIGAVISNNDVGFDSDSDDDDDDYCDGDDDDIDDDEFDR